MRCVMSGFGMWLVCVISAVGQESAEMKPYVEKISGTDITFEMLPIPAGSFEMGSAQGEKDRAEDEGPRHTVKVGAFWMARCETTWAAYDVWGEKMDIRLRQVTGLKPNERDKVADAVTRPTPPYTDMSFSMGKGKQPAICMTQHAARTYCRWLSAKTGHYYRLPTEAEWEYACRAGTTTAWHFGDEHSSLSDYAWYSGNCEKYQPVGQKKPNPWGLHDMHGNVAEWVLDQYDTKFYGKSAKNDPLNIPLKLYPRVVRGGGWSDNPDLLRSAARTASGDHWKEQDPQEPQSIWYHTDARWVGFRVVRPLAVPSDEARMKKWDKTEPEQKDPPEEIE